MIFAQWHEHAVKVRNIVTHSAADRRYKENQHHLHTFKQKKRALALVRQARASSGRGQVSAATTFCRRADKEQRQQSKHDFVKDDAILSDLNRSHHQRL
jgi:DUF438 domain-containing protein